MEPTPSLALLGQCKGQRVLGVISLSGPAHIQRCKGPVPGSRKDGTRSTWLMALSSTSGTQASTQLVPKEVFMEKRRERVSEVVKQGRRKERAVGGRKDRRTSQHGLIQGGSAGSAPASNPISGIYCDLKASGMARTGTELPSTSVPVFHL